VRIFAVPLGLGFLGLLATHLIATPVGEYSFVLTAMQWAYEKPAPTYLHAWFIAYGPIIALGVVGALASMTVTVR
jgi:hypothetical protein